MKKNKVASIMKPVGVTFFNTSFKCLTRCGSPVSMTSCNNWIISSIHVNTEGVSGDVACWLDKLNNIKAICTGAN